MKISGYKTALIVFILIVLGFTCGIDNIDALPDNWQVAIATLFFVIAGLVYLQYRKNRKNGNELIREYYNYPRQ